MNTGRYVLAFFLLMGLAVMVYLFLTGAFLSGAEATAWQNALEEPLNDIGVDVDNFALFVAISLVFGIGFLLPLTIAIVRMIT